MGGGCSKSRVKTIMVGSGNKHQVQMGKDGRVSLTARARERRPSIQYGDLLFFGIHVKFSELYQKQEQIGKGNFGIVYKAYCKQYRVAVKELFYSTKDKDITEVDFHKEVDILTRLQHPNIVRFLGAVQQAPHLCIIMEYCETSVTGFLEQVAQGEIQISFGLLVKIALGVAQALQYMHHEIEPQVIHRDVKADNLLLTEDFDIKLTDFGLSRSLEEKKPTQMTLCGSVLWVAPEIIRGDPYDNKVDTYSYGICIWELFNLAKPYSEYDPANVPYLVTVRFERPRNNPHVPKYISHLSELCWQDDPSGRPGFPEIVKYLEKASKVIDERKIVDTGSTYEGAALTPSMEELEPVFPASESSIESAGLGSPELSSSRLPQFKPTAGTGSVFNNDGSGSFRGGSGSFRIESPRAPSLAAINERPKSTLKRIVSIGDTNDFEKTDGSKISEYQKDENDDEQEDEIEGNENDNGDMTAKSEEERGPSEAKSDTALESA